MLKKFMKAALTASLIFGLSAPVMAEDASWNFYGNVRMAVFQDTLSKELSGLGEADSDLAFGMASNSRIGAKIKKGKVSANIEYGSAANLRHFYATVNMGGGQLLMGQTWCPSVALLHSGQVYAADNGLVALGGFYAGRLEQIAFRTGGLNVALIKPSTAYGLNTLGMTVTDTDVSIPKIEGTYSLAAGPAKITVLAGTQSFKQTVGGNSYAISSTVIGAAAMIAAGPAKVGLALFSATNPGNYGAYVAGGKGYAGIALYDAAGDAVTNTTTTGMTVVVRAAGLEFGYGMDSTKYDVTDSKVDVTTATYLNYPIKMDSGLMVVPEAGLIDYAKDLNDAKQGSKTYLGAKLQLNF